MKIHGHNALACLAVAWLRGKVTSRNMRGNFEIPVGLGYVPDYVALAWFQYRLLKRYGIPEREIRELPDGMHVFECPSLLIVIEAKATRSDFLSTFNDSEHHSNRKSPVGSLHWVVANREIVHPGEVPSFWGLLEPSGRGLREIKKPEFCKVDRDRFCRVAHTLLWAQEPSRYVGALQNDR